MITIIKMNTIQELQEEEDEIYRNLEEFSKILSEDKKVEFFRLLSELIEVNIELEKLCSQ